MVDSRFLIATLLLVLLPVMLAAVWAIAIEPDLLMERRITVEPVDWPGGWEPLRIAVVSDLHVGAPHVKLDKLETVVDRVNALGADLIVLLGDFVFPDMPWGRVVGIDVIARHLGRLQAPLGVISVLGNHDWYFGGESVRKELESAGIIVLENGAVARTIGEGRIWVAGVADQLTRHPDPVETVAVAPEGEPVILLTHDPGVFSDVPDRVALILAGHTHGGQVSIPFFGALMTYSRAPRRHAYGLVREAGKLMYVTSGVGTSIIPLRFNIPPEIVLITLR